MCVYLGWGRGGDFDRVRFGAESVEARGGEITPFGTLARAGMMSSVAAEQAFWGAVAPAGRAVLTFALIVVVVGVMVAPAAVTFGRGGMEFAERRACWVAQHMASPALDEAGAVACNYKFSLLTEHENFLLGRVLDDSIGGVHDRD